MPRPYINYRKIKRGRLIRDRPFYIVSFRQISTDTRVIKSPDRPLGILVIHHESDVDLRAALRDKLDIDPRRAQGAEHPPRNTGGVAHALADRADYGLTLIHRNI